MLELIVSCAFEMIVQRRGIPFIFMHMKQKEQMCVRQSFFNVLPHYNITEITQKALCHCL